MMDTLLILENFMLIFYFAKERLHICILSCDIIMKIGLYAKNIEVMVLLILQMVLSDFESLLGSLFLKWHFRYLGIGTTETLGEW